MVPESVHSVGQSEQEPQPQSGSEAAVDPEAVHLATNEEGRGKANA